MSSCFKPLTMILFALFSFTVFESGNTQRRQSFNLDNYLNEELLTGFDDTQNYFISPASIKATLGMVLESSGGDVAVEISKAIGIPPDQSIIRKKVQNMLYDLNDNTHGTTVQSANAVFLSKLYGIIPEYQQNIRRFYSADVHPIDFSKPSIASNTINSWVRTSTTGLIPEIVSPEMFNADTELVLANALYFKGQWKVEFDERNTAIKCFHTRKNGCINARMMQTVDQFYYKSFDELRAQAIQLPYGDGKYAMVVLLPSEKHSVERLIKDLQHHSLSSIVRRLDPRNVTLNLPKFEIDYSEDIVPLLKNLGVTEIFNQNANLSGIVEKGQVKVNNIIHKAKIEVNEKGTIAAAATGVIVIPLMGSSMPRFMADRPFLFFIYHVPTNNILFEGRLNEVPETFDEIFTKPPERQPISQNQPINHQVYNNPQDPSIVSIQGQDNLLLFSTATHTRPHSERFANNGRK